MSSREERHPAHQAAWLSERLEELSEEVLTGDLSEHIPDEAIQQLMTSAVKLYVAKMEGGSDVAPFIEGEVTATEVAVAASEMLKAVEMEVFELGMWQVWGRS